jgi:hypothetical protein
LEVIHPIIIIYSSTAINNIAHLMYNDIGLGVNMEYSSSGSSSTITDARSYIIGRGYTCSSIRGYNDTDVVNALLQNKLVYSRADSERHSFLGIIVWYSGRHAWVIDGVIHKKRVHSCYPTGYQYHALVHCNFGWRGGYNGYYIGGAFTSRTISDGTWPYNNQPPLHYVYNNKIMIINH